MLRHRRLTHRITVPVSAGLLTDTDAYVHARRDSAVHRVADLLITHPVLNAQLLQRELGIRTRNARRYLDPLADAGIIVEFADRNRNRAWRASEILSALDAFAARAGRRAR